MKQLTSEQKKKVLDLIQSKRKSIDDMTSGINVSIATSIANQTKEYRDLLEGVQDAISKAYDIIEEYRPEDGYTPVVGKDFHTPEEKRMFAQAILDVVMESVPTTEDIVAQVIPQIVITPAKDGETPSENYLESLIIKLMPKPKDTPTILTQNSIAEAKGLTIDDVHKSLKEKGGLLEELREYTKTMFNRAQAEKNNWRGGGDTVGAGTNITITTVNGTKIISSTGGSGTSQVYNEVAGFVSGTSFTVSQTPAAGSVRVYARGQRLYSGVDYTISGTAITIIGGSSYAAGDIVLDYAITAVATNVFNEVVSGSGTSFTLANTPTVGSVALYGRGQRLYVGTDYSITGTAITTINTWSASDLVADYTK